VHRHISENHPGALGEGRIFDCKTDVVVCSRAYGMGLAPYSLFDDITYIYDEAIHINTPKRRAPAVMRPIIYL
jgi:hypothetical protein